MKGDSLGLITAHSVEVFSVIANQNGAKVEECGFLIVREGTTDTLSIPVDVEVNKAPIYINATIDSLEPNTYYIIYPYARNKEGRGTGAELKVRTKSGLPEVQTLVQTDSVRGRSAYVGLHMSEKGEAPIVRIGLIFADNTDMSNADTISLAQAIPQGNDSLMVRIGSLQMTTTYYVQAFATNTYGIYKGEVQSFTTTNGSPVLGKLEVFEIKHTEASYSATIISAGESEVLARGICWADSSRIPTIDDNQLVNNSAGFTGAITNLITGVKYNARAYAINEYGIGYSEVFAFVAENDWNLSIFSIDKGMAMARVDDIVKKGIVDISYVGICWATHPEPTIADNYREMETDFVSPFSLGMTKLRGEATYYVRAFVRNSSDFITYSKEETFKTPDIFSPQAPFPGSTRLPNSLTSFTNGAGNMAYLLGGDRGSNFTNELWAYNASDRWDNMGAFPDTPRKWQSAVVIKDVAYVFGGVDNTNISTNRLHRYMMGYNQWDSIPATGLWPAPVHSAAGAPFFDLAYFIGGNRMGAASNEVWAYNTIYTGWERRPNFPVGMQKGIAINYQNTLYAGFGYTGADGESYERRLWSIQYSGNTWIEETSLPEEAGHIRTVTSFQMFRSDRIIRAIFMVDDTGTIWMYDIDLKTWERKSQLPASNRGNYQHCMFVIDNAIYIGLGISYTSLIKYSPDWDN